MEVQHVEVDEASREQAMPGLEAGVPFAPEPGQIEVARAGQVRPEPHLLGLLV